MTSRGRTRILAGALGVAALSYAALVLGRGLYDPPQAEAWTASSLTTVGAGTGDIWYNYDFVSTSVSASNVDWPVRYLFKGNAEVDMVKNTIDGCGGDPSIFPCLGGSGSQKKFYGRTSGSWYWDEDGGKKMGASCELDQHIRVYAIYPADRNYDPAIGYYVLASVHKDYEGPSCTDVYYSAEGEQGWWDSRSAGISGWSTTSNNYWWNNYESARWGDTSHWIQSDGYSTYVTLP